MNGMSKHLHDCEQAQLRMSMLETLAENLRAERDRVFQEALQAGVSVHALSRLVGLSRQSIMRIRDLDLPDPLEGSQMSLEEELSPFFDGEDYDPDGDGRVTLL